MALRLAGEECSVVRGLDDLGWLKEVTRNTSDYALKITQNGSGDTLQVVGSRLCIDRSIDGDQLRFYRSGSLIAGFDIGGAYVSLWSSDQPLLLSPGGDKNIALGGKADLQKGAYNSTANNSGDVLVDDDLALTAGKKLRLEGAGSDSYFVFQNNRIEVFINGVLEGYIDTTGFVST